MSHRQSKTSISTHSSKPKASAASKHKGKIIRPSNSLQRDQWGFPAGAIPFDRAQCKANVTTLDESRINNEIKRALSDMDAADLVEVLQFVTEALKSKLLGHHLQAAMTESPVSGKPVTETPAERLKRKFESEGRTVAEWARENGFPAVEVYKILNGATKGRRGRGHKIAAMLGLKPGGAA